MVYIKVGTALSFTESRKILFASGLLVLLSLSAVGTFDFDAYAISFDELVLPVDTSALGLTNTDNILAIVNIGNVDEIIIGQPIIDDFVVSTDSGKLFVLFMDNDEQIKSNIEISDVLPDGTIISSIANIGDLNHDGVNDIVVGASESNKSFTIFMARDKDSITRNDIIVSGIGDTAKFGSSIANIGDLDRDGVNDIAVGASGDNKLFVIYLKSDGSLKSSLVVTVAEHANFGTSVTNIGDLNKDGVTDIIVGSSDNNTLYVLFMEKDGSVLKFQPITVSELTIGAKFGSSIANIGDLNRDGVNDIVVGASGDNKLFVIYLNNDGVVIKSTEINNTTPIGKKISKNGKFGSSVANIGDYNHDGVVDVMIGSKSVDAPGALQIIHFTAIHPIITLDNLIDSYTQINNGTENIHIRDYDLFGFVIEDLGDLDGDGVLDVIIGSPNRETVATRQATQFGNSDDNGAVNILLMNNDGTVKKNVEINGSTVNGPKLGFLASFGYSITNIGDIDNDGVVDIVVGAYADSEFGEFSGKLYVIFLNSDGTVKETVEINNETLNALALTPNGFFGTSITNIGDLNRDGVNDIAVGAYGTNDGSGAVYILYLSSDGSVISTQEIPDPTPVHPDPTPDDLNTLPNHFGIHVSSIGDIDNDGVVDIAVGSYVTYVKYTTVPIPEQPSKTFESDSRVIVGNLDIIFLNSDGTVKKSIKINHETYSNLNIQSDSHFGLNTQIIGDLNRDGVNDIMVSAPFDYPEPAEYVVGAIYEYGAIHVLFLDSYGSIIKSLKIDGNNDNGFPVNISNRLGKGIAVIGDNNSDGIPDIAASTHTYTHIPYKQTQEGAYYQFQSKPPVIINDVFTTIGDGDYLVGTPIDIFVKFSGEVTVTGTPKLELQTGVIDTTLINYDSGSGGDTLKFQYTTKSDDYTTDLEYVNINSLVLSDGDIISDIYGDPVTPELPVPRGLNSLSDNGDIGVNSIPQCEITTTTVEMDFGLVKVGEISTNDNVSITVDVSAYDKNVVRYDIFANDWFTSANDKILDKKFFEVKDHDGIWQSLENTVTSETETLKGSSSTFEFRVNLENQDNVILSSITPGDITGSFSVEPRCD